MSRKFATILLAFLFLYASGVAQKANAQMKSLTLPTMKVRPDFTCTTLLQTYFVIQNGTCEDTHLSQIDLVVRAAALQNTDQAVEFAYSTEPTYFVPPSPSPSPDQPLTIPVETTPTSVVDLTIQAPHDNVPADSANLNSDLILNLINQHRAGIGKPGFIKDDALCTLARTRSTELSDELFVNHNLHSGLYNRNLPYWITENAKWGSNEAGTVQWWLNSPIHRSAIEGDYVYSCGACNGSMCSQLFTTYTPKMVPTTPLEVTKQ